MRKVLTFLIIAMLATYSFWFHTSAHAASQSLVISEVMMGDSTSASHEFIELYNNSSSDISMLGWGIDYKSATGTTWSKRATGVAEDIVLSHSFIVLDTDVEGGLHLSSGMSQSGGNIRLHDDKGAVIDQFAWGNGDSPETSAVPPPATGKSLARGLNADASILGDTDNNSTDFHTSLSTTPGLPPSAEMEQQSDDDNNSTPSNSYSISVVISELLPDPVSPLTDSKDEFIELYNQSNQAASLDAWSLRDASGHSYKLVGFTIPANSYAVFNSGATKISLNNDGDEISLVDPGGLTVDTSPNYDNAKPGLTWGLSLGEWAWLEHPTPGSTNASALTLEITALANKSTSSKSIKSASSKPKSTAAKKSVPRKVAKAIPASQPASGINVAGGQSSRLWAWLLIGLGIGTIGYGAYAYKPEIIYYLHKLRTKLSSR